MNISQRLHIPNRETFLENQGGRLLPSQKDFLAGRDNNNYQIHTITDKFTFFPEDNLYGFQSSSIAFYEKQTEYACKDGRLLPGVIYRIFYTLDSQNVQIFLSAEATQTPTEEIVYPALIAPLQTKLLFSGNDVRFNKQGRLSDSQEKKIKGKKKKTSLSNHVSNFDFVYVGNETLTLMPEEKFTNKVSRFFSSYDSIFLLNVKYRIYYETNTKAFLSIEPIEMLEPEFALPYLSINNNVEYESVQQKEPNWFVALTIKGIKGITIAMLLFIALPLAFFTIGMWAITNIKFGWIISICSCGAGVWIWIAIANNIWKSITRK